VLAFRPVPSLVLVSLVPLVGATTNDPGFVFSSSFGWTTSGRRACPYRGKRSIAYEFPLGPVFWCVGQVTFSRGPFCSFPLSLPA